MPTFGSRLLIAALLFQPAAVHASDDAQERFLAVEDKPLDQMSDAERAAIWREIDATLSRLDLPKAGERPSFRWPLRAARGYSAPGSNRVINFVDHDATLPG